MLEIDVDYNDYGEVKEVYDLEPYTHTIKAIWSRPLDVKVMNEVVMNYRLLKNPSKLSEFERCSLTGEAWVPILNKKQRERLKRSLDT